jgi:hypothetical protein
MNCNVRVASEDVHVSSRSSTLTNPLKLEKLHNRPLVYRRRDHLEIPYYRTSSAMSSIRLPHSMSRLREQDAQSCMAHKQQ